MEETPSILKSKKLPALDGLRAISIILVIVSHFIFYSNLSAKRNIGTAGVYIFFVISGFLITTLLLKERILNGRISLQKFYIRRALRILPVVILFLIVLLVLNLIFTLQIGSTSFLASIFFVRNLPIPNIYDWYTAHLWSLSVEQQFYLIFPFLLTRMNIKKYKNFILTFIITIPFLNYLFSHNLGFSYLNKPTHIAAMIFMNLFGKGTALILVGSYLSILMFTQPKLPAFIKSINRRYLSLFIFIFALSIRIPSFSSDIQFFSDIIFAFLIGIVILLNLHEESYFTRFLNLKLLTRIGVLSYSLYIWQQLFTSQQPWQKSFKYSDSVIFNLTMLVVVSLISYHLFEKKFLQIKSRFINASGSRRIRTNWFLLTKKFSLFHGNR